MKKPVSTKFTPSLKQEGLAQQWYLVDLKDKILGRAATRIAVVLRGKHRPDFTPHIDHGDHVVAINAREVKLTGKKITDKVYYRHSGYPGGLKSTTAEKMVEKHPDFLLKHAVKGMLPKGPLGRKLLKKLKIYEGSDHPHTAQKPELLKV